MRLLLILILTFLFGASYGQSFAYPSIKSNGQSINEFVPFNWTILDSTTGDLNKDGIKDAVIILQHTESLMLVNNKNDTVLAQPRILLILFKNLFQNRYDLMKQSNSFILTHDNFAKDDPYQAVSIDKEIIKIDFHVFYNMGSWYTASSTYKFRYDGKTFGLIGAELSTIYRATLDFEDYSYNFLTKKRKYTKGNDQTGTKKITVKSLSIQKPVTLDTFIEPFTWEVEPGIYL